MKRKYWTKEEVADLVRLYPTMIGEELAERFGCSVRQLYDKAQNLGVKKDQQFLHAYYKANYSGHPATQFKKGQKSWNKGTKGVMKGGVQTQFKKGQIPHNIKPIGYRSERKGYITEKTALGFKFVHVLLWEAHNGPVPTNHIVTFRDGNSRNIVLENLELIDRHEHMRRNHIKNLPDDIREVITIKRELIKKINKIQKDGTK